MPSYFRIVCLANIPQEGQYSSEDEVGLSSGDEEHVLEHEGQPPFEVEQLLSLEVGEGPLAQGHRQLFSCDLCPDSFLTAETLTMVLPQRSVCWVPFQLTFY